MIAFTVEKMHCGGCAGRVTRAIQAVDPEARVEIDLKSKTVRVDSDASAMQIQKSVVDAGYPVMAA